ncbi:MAG: glutamate-5-semialdehyde dehydrogenase [Proteobacteria bacterium]|nr:glutamate-5-semialdehyde dehydrogenase [Pseudomonadota bacterium]
MKQQAKQLAQTARRLAQDIGNASSAQKNAVLNDFAKNLNNACEQITAANQQDLVTAEKNNIDAALHERLLFDPPRIAATADAVLQIAAQSDPIGAIDEMRTMPSGIQVGKMRIPLGVLLIIFESRPNVTADAAALSLKAGNAVILRGGSEARHTNSAIADCLEQALAAHGLSRAAQVIENPAHDLVGELLAREDDIDLVIPRGGRGLIERVMRDTRIPVLKHLDGNCHVYIDSAAETEMALSIVENSKTRRYGVCNAAESLLIHHDVAATLLPPLAMILAKHHVEMRVCSESQKLLTNVNVPGATIVAASEDDWQHEYLAAIISIKIVPSLAAAIEHINQYGSAHSDAIVSNDINRCMQFARAVDSSSVLINAATGYADGGEYGLGAEIGISTGKLHARGPVGAQGLTTQKYIVIGNGHCR